MWLDLAVEDPSLSLAPNFILDEVAQEWKGRYAVVQPHAIQRLQDMRDVLGPLIVNSGYRNVTYNASVGGSTWSRHMWGDAFDLDPVSVSLDVLADTCAESGAGYIGVYESHIHCDWRDDPIDLLFFGPERAALHTVQPELFAEAFWDGDALSTTREGWDEGEPLREWTAYSVDGRLLETARGRFYVPPADAARVLCTVGKAFDVWVAL
jgi:hypothetical protein